MMLKIIFQKLGGNNMVNKQIVLNGITYIENFTWCDDNGILFEINVRRTINEKSR